VRDGDWKLLTNDNRTRVELYQLSTDPDELANLAAAHPEQVRRLTTLLDAWRASLPVEVPTDCTSKRRDAATK
jgi:N-acetylgalactosamine-6-sulfatase